MAPRPWPSGVKHDRGRARTGAIEAMGALNFLFQGRCLLVQHHDRRLSHLDEFRSDMVACSSCSATAPFIRWSSLANHGSAKNVHARIDAGGLGGKIVLLPWLVSQGVVDHRPAGAVFGTPSP